MAADTPSSPEKWAAGLTAQPGFIALLVGASVIAGLAAWVLREGDRGGARRPRIGVSYDTTILNHLGLTRAPYDLALARVGADVTTLRPDSEASPAELIAGLDGLLLSGGGDVDPALYGKPDQPAQLVDRGRDEFELALLSAALQRGIPVLGICRGLQLINVAMGGELVDMRTSDPERHATHGIGLESLSAHAVTIQPGSRLAAAQGVPERRVTSFHGQAIAGRSAVPGSLIASATAPDGVVEAVEIPEESGGPWLVAVQWHPEMESMTDAYQLALFRALADQARLGPRAGSAPTVRTRTPGSTGESP
jgi:putative glutamine amidotransferase